MTAVRLLDLPADAVFGHNPALPRLVDMSEDDIYRWGEAKYRRLGAPLTPMEMRILHSRGSGEPNKETAHRFGITEQTVKNHITSSYGKLGVNTIIEAFIALGWLTVPDAPSQRAAERAYRTEGVLRDLVRAMDAARVLLAHVDDIPEPTVNERVEEA